MHLLGDCSLTQYTSLMDCAFALRQEHMHQIALEISRRDLQYGAQNTDSSFLRDCQKCTGFAMFSDSHTCSPFVLSLYVATESVEGLC